MLNDNLFNKLCQEEEIKPPVESKKKKVFKKVVQPAAEPSVVLNVEPAPVAVPVEEPKLNPEPLRDRVRVVREAEEIVQLVEQLTAKGIKDRHEQVAVIKSIYPDFNNHEVIGYNIWNGITRFIYKGIRKDVR